DRVALEGVDAALRALAPAPPRDRRRDLLHQALPRPLGQDPADGGPGPPRPAPAPPRHPDPPARLRPSGHLRGPGRAEPPLARPGRAAGPGPLGLRPGDDPALRGALPRPGPAV